MDSIDGSNLERLLTALDVVPHAFSVCRVQSGWRMTFPVFKVFAVHFVLQGTGHLGVGESQPLPFAPSSVLVAPAMQAHWVGDAEPAARIKREDPLREDVPSVPDARFHGLYHVDLRATTATYAASSER